MRIYLSLNMSNECCCCHPITCEFTLLWMVILCFVIKWQMQYWFLLLRKLKTDFKYSIFFASTFRSIRIYYFAICLALCIFSGKQGRAETIEGPGQIHDFGFPYSQYPPHFFVIKIDYVFLNLFYFGNNFFWLSWSKLFN